MKKRTLTFVAAGALALGIGIVGGIPLFASNDTAQTTQSTEQAQAQGQPTQMSEEEIQQQATELGISTDGKDTQTLMQEIREAQLKQDAAELGISTDGKDTQALEQEVQAAKVLQVAKELSIDTTDKTTQELIQEITEKSPDSLKDLGFMGGSGNGTPPSGGRGDNGTRPSGTPGQQSSTQSSSQATN